MGDYAISIMLQAKAENQRNMNNAGKARAA